MYADLNVPWPNLPSAQAVEKVKPVLAFAEQLGYDIVALSIATGQPKELKDRITTSFTPQAFSQLQQQFPQLKLLRRVTVLLGDTHPNIAHYSSVQLASKETVNFDIIAAKPQNERHFLNCATALDIDLIVLDTTGRLPYPLRHKPCGAAIARGVRFEVNYAPALNADRLQQRHLIANAAVLFRVCRSRGVVVSSGAESAALLRAPLDIVNLVNLWGLSMVAARESVGKAAVTAATQGILRARSVKQAIIEEPKRKKQKVA